VLIFRVPDGALAEYVRWIWLYRGEALGFQGEIVMPTGDPDLVVDLTRARTVASGPSNRPFVLDTGTPREAIGAVLKIGGAATLLGVPLTELRNRRVPLAALWGRSAADLVERALEAQSATQRLEAFQQLLAARVRGHTHTRYALAGTAAARIAWRPAGCRVAGLSETLGVSARRLEQVFRTEVGLTPKAYQRLHRFRRALASVDRAADIGWAALALELGYYDQAHFIGDFHAHAGMTPSEYVARRGTELNHVPVEA
jgi:methylphosphotriester-DNA--protein-cysteine methyltransferase